MTRPLPTPIAAGFMALREFLDPDNLRAVVAALDPADPSTPPRIGIDLARRIVDLLEQAW